MSRRRGESLINVLSQLRDNYDSRPEGAPISVVLWSAGRPRL